MPVMPAMLATTMAKKLFLEREFFMEKIFKLKENGTTVRTEIVAGLTTFMTMAYIIALNPNLSRGC